MNKYSFFSPISEEKINVDKDKKSSKSFFLSKKEKNTPDTGELVKENFKKAKENSSNKKVNINNISNAKNWDLSEEAIGRELDQIKNSKKKP